MQIALARNDSPKLTRPRMTRDSTGNVYKTRVRDADHSAAYQCVKINSNTSTLSTCTATEDCDSQSLLMQSWPCNKHQPCTQALVAWRSNNWKKSQPTLWLTHASASITQMAPARQQQPAGLPPAACWSAAVLPAKDLPELTIIPAATAAGKRAVHICASRVSSSR